MLGIVIPAYNEEANIRKVVQSWYQVVERVKDAFLLIVDDGSRDDTYGIALSMCQEMPKLVVRTKQNQGHGPSILWGYRYCLQEGADWIFQTDSDGQTDPEDFWGLWNGREDYAFSIGSRTARQDGTSRVLVTKALKGLLLLIFGRLVEDSNCPFRLMKSTVLNEYLQIIPGDFSLANVLISTVACCRGARIRWIPVSFKPRQGGKNSINMRRIFSIGARAVGALITFRRLNRSFLYPGRST